MSVAAGPNIIEKGLVLCLDAGNKKSYPGSGTVLKDLSGNENNGSLINGVGFNSANKGGLVFDGVNDYVGLLSSSTLGKSLNYTTSAWVNYRDVGYTGWMIICDSVNYGVGGGYMMWLSSDSPTSGKVLASFDGNWQVATVRIPPNKWTNVCISKNNNQLSFYINGQFDVTITYNFNSSLSDANVDIGGSPRNGYPFNGTISNVQIYNRALSPTEILQNYNATKGRFRLT